MKLRERSEEAMLVGKGRKRKGDHSPELRRSKRNAEKSGKGVTFTPPPPSKSSRSSDNAPASSLKIVNPKRLNRLDSYRTVKFTASTSTADLRVDTSNFAGGISFMSPYRFHASAAVPTPRTPKLTTRITVDMPERDEHLFGIVQSGTAKALKKALNEDASRIDAKESVHGYTMLMTSAALGKAKEGFEKCSILIEYGADLTLKDNSGFTCLHWAAALGYEDTLKLLFHAMNTSGVDPKDGIDAQSNNGDTALHRASRFNFDRCVKALVEEAGASVTIQNNDHFTAFDSIGSFADASPSKSAHQKARLRTRAQFYDSSSFHKTLILHHPDCMEHITAKDHQEAPERITAILNKLDTISEPKCVHLSTEFRYATTEMLLYAHSKTYINFVHNLHRNVMESMKSVPFTPQVQRAVVHIAEDKVKADKGCDTTFSPGSLMAGLRAVGAVCHAVDMVVTGKSRNAFCVVRPPGHHAGVDGLLQNAVSCGFCIFNNVAIAAKHALKEHPDVVKRVAIIDFDVHHGNGTEETICKGKLDPSSVFFCSLHLYDKESNYEFYPGSGRRDLIAHNVVNVPIKPLWRKPSVKSSGASMTSTRRHGTRSASSSSSQSSKASDDGSAAETPQTHEDNGVDSPMGSFSGTPRTNEPFGRSEFRHQLSHRLLPALRAFSPDLILISAGFDAGKNDIGCSNASGRSGCDLQPSDYEWATDQVLAVARICCDGRVVSALEGGYGRWQRAPKSSSRRYVMTRDNLASNVVGGHIKSLVSWHEGSFFVPRTTPKSTPKSS